MQGLNPTQPGLNIGCPAPMHGGYFSLQEIVQLLDPVKDDNNYSQELNYQTYMKHRIH